MDSKFILPLALFLLAYVQSSQGIKCYECYPNKDTDCETENWSKVDCEGGQDAYCRKMRQNVLGKVQVVRQCGKAKGGKEKLSYATANDYVKATVYHCSDGDFCNAGGRSAVSGIFFVFALILAAYFR